MSRSAATFSARPPTASTGADAMGPPRLAAVCAAAIGFGASLVLSAGDALFLHRVGAEYLGAAFAVSSALLVVVLAAVGARADGGRRERLLFSIALASAALLGIAMLLSERAPEASATIVLVGGKQMAAALELAFWVLLAERFDARQIRRSLPRLIAAQGVGLALGSLAAGLLAASVGALALVGVGALAFLAAGLIAPRVARSGALRPLPRGPASGGVRLGLRSGATTVMASPLARKLVLLVALGGAAAPILYYLLGLRASAAFTDEADLAAFFGGFRGAVQILTVALQAALASRLIARAGIATVLVIAPVVTIAAAIGVLIRPELAAIIIAQAAVKLVDGALETPAQKLAQNLTGREIRGRITGFLDGVAKRAGAIVGGGLAALLAPRPLIIAAVVIGGLWLVAALIFRRRFPELAVSELSERKPRDVADDEALNLDARSVAQLRQALMRGGHAMERALTVLRELDQSGADVDLVGELLRAIRETDGAVPASIIAELAGLVDQGREIPGGDALASLESGSGAQRRLLARISSDRAVLAPLERDDQPDVALAARLSRLRTERRLSLADFDVADAERELVALALRELARAVVAESLDPDDLGRAVRALVRAGASADPLVSRAAVAALASVAGRQEEASEHDHGDAAAWMIMRAPLPELAARVARDRGADPLTRAAAIALWTATASADADTIASDIAPLLGDPDRDVVAAAERCLRSLGSDAVEALLRIAVFGRRRARAPALELLRDLRVPTPVLDELIDREAESVASSAARLIGLRALAARGGALLRRRVEERIREGAHTLFLLVEARLGRPSIGAAARRLRYARHRAVRARALEALDAALPRRFAGLLGVLDSSPTQARAQAGADHVGVEIPGSREAISKELAAGDRLSRRMAIYALGDVGRSEYRDDIAEAAEDALSEADPEDLARRLTSLLVGAGSDERAPEPDNAGEARDNDVAEMAKSIESVVVLSELPLFADLSTRELAELADVVSWMSVSTGEVLIEQGDVGDAMYFVLDGEVSVERQGADGEVELASLGRGEPFGEMALFDDQVRSATVTATRASRLGRIERIAFEEIVAEVPGIALGICRVMSRRVRSTNGS